MVLKQIMNVFIRVMTGIFSSFHEEKDGMFIPLGRSDVAS
jgi:hypothetical protein